MTLRTKEALADSLEKLLNARTLDKITVKDVVEDAGVNRQTFYYHFRDIYDLIQWIFEQKTTEVLNQAEEAADLHASFIRIILAIREERDLILNTFRSMGRDYLENYMFSTVERLLRPALENDPLCAQVDQADRDFVLRFYCNALVGVLEDWMRQGMRGEAEPLAGQLCRVMDGEIHRTLLRFTGGTEKN